jgi:molecular chaperone GrpE
MSAMFKKSRPDESKSERADDERDTSSEQPELTDRDDSSATGDVASGDAPRGDIARLERERDEHLQNWKRATADYQNLRRRLQSDIDAASQRSKQPLLLDLLLVLDYLEMALKSPATTAEAKNLHGGVELTRDVLLRTLERENVRPVAESGAFDASVHQAVESVATSERAPGTILETLRRGFTSNGQVLRPAQVRVAVAESSDASDGDENEADSAGATEI